jgi:hypothetical protein
MEEVANVKQNQKPSTALATIDRSSPQELDNDEEEDSDSVSRKRSQAAATKQQALRRLSDARTSRYGAPARGALVSIAGGAGSRSAQRREEQRARSPGILVTTSLALLSFNFPHHVHGGAIVTVFPLPLNRYRREHPFPLGRRATPRAATVV